MIRDDVKSKIKRGWDSAARSTSSRTKDYFAELVKEYPDDCAVQYAFACALDFAGDEVGAAQAYSECHWEELPVEDQVQGWVQYAATLRNIGRSEEAMRTITLARDLRQDALAPVMYEALILVDGGQPIAAVQSLLRHLVERSDDELVRRYRWALRRYISALPRD